MISKNSKKYLSKKYILIFLFLASNSEVFTQPNNDSKKIMESSSLLETKFEQLPTELSLSNVDINCIAQDKDGYMWFPSKPGLIKYDGKNFKAYGSGGFNESFNDSTYLIVSNAIPSSLLDKEGSLWFGTSGGVLAKYDRDYDKFIGIDLSEDDNAPYCGHINAIVEDQNGELVIGTNKGGLRIFNKKTQTFKYYYDANSDLSSNILLSLYIDEKGIIYIGTEDKGLFIFDISNNKFINYRHSSDSSSLSDNRVQCIYEDSKNNIWVGTSNGLNLFDRQRNKFNRIMNEPYNLKSISYNNITDICEDKNNILWIATFGGGLDRYEKDGTFTKYKSDISNPSSLSSDFLLNLFVDDSNVLWIGTRDRGVCKIDLEKKKFFTISRFFQNSTFSKTNDVTSVYMDSSGLFWVAARLNKGIFIFTKDNNEFLAFKEYSVMSDTLVDQTITSCLEDKNHNIWFSSVLGKLFEYERNSKSYRIFTCKTGHKFWRLLYIDDDQIFIATTSGFLKFDLNKKEFSVLNPDSDSLRFFDKFDQQWSHIDKEKNLWFPWDAVMKYEIDKDKFTGYKNVKSDTNSYQGAYFQGMYEDSKGHYFFTSELGLNMLNKSTGEFKLFPVETGENILEDNSGILWCATNYEYGLSEFNPETSEYRLYNITDGLQGNRFNYFGANTKDKEGNLYFGGTNGLTYFNPNEIKDNSYIPNIVITDFQIFNESVKPSYDNPFLKQSITDTKEINLSFKENVFSFEFAALIYNNPSKNQYAYMMEGFDKDWVYCGTRRNVTYTNLDPGDYTFRVKGSNNDGIWNEEGTSVKITIIPPWWKAIWFKSCGAALIFMTVGFGFRKRFNKMKKEKEAQEEFSRKLLASQESERKRIANELHDSIAHDILILKNNAVIAMNNTKEEETRSALNEISEQSSSTLNEVRSISYNLHPHQIEALGITKAIKSMVEKVSKSTNIKFILEEDVIDNLFTVENEVYLFRVIQESINNIIKHSSASEAIIKITRKDDFVSIIISDNGKGFSLSKDVNKNSLGLSGISERVKMLGGTLKIESEKGEGTVFKIDLPTSHQLSS